MIVISHVQWIQEGTCERAGEGNEDPIIAQYPSALWDVNHHTQTLILMHNKQWVIFIF